MIRSFEIEGLNLPKDKKDKLKKVEDEITDLSSKFGKNSISDDRTFEIKASELKDVPDLIMKELKNVTGKPGYALLST